MFYFRLFCSIFGIFFSIFSRYKTAAKRIFQSAGPLLSEIISAQRHLKPGSYVAVAAGSGSGSGSGSGWGGTGSGYGGSGSGSGSGSVRGVLGTPLGVLLGTGGDVVGGSGCSGSGSGSGYSGSVAVAVAQWQWQCVALGGGRWQWDRRMLRICHSANDCHTLPTTLATHCHTATLPHSATATF
jgi:hypothetical protein